MKMSRRFFLGGAISLIAAQTFIPSVDTMANIPTIYGDGKRDDSGGLGALFRNEPVTFNKEQIGVESHDGIVFHNGTYAISRTVIIPDEVKLKIERAVFISKDLPYDDVFFWLSTNENKDTYEAFNGNMGLIFECNRAHRKLVHIVETEDVDKQKSYY